MRDIFSYIHKYIDILSIANNGNRLQRYGFVFLLISIFFLIKTAFMSVIGIDVPFLFSLFIVIICAWIGGFGPGILATILSGGITYFFFLEPKYTLFGEENIPNVIVLIVFFAEGFFISAMSETHRKSDIQKSEFIGVISHELKNPLTSIKGYAELIQRLASKKGEQKFADYALRIDQQVKQVIEMINDMLEMINDMLDITKIETGRFTYQDEIFNVTDLVKELVGDLQVTTDTHKIRFIAKGSKMITGDRYRIGQVVTNLISNAIKYAPNTKKINVTVENKKDGVIIAIQDFGPGITKEDQLKLFKPFFRAKNTQIAKGTGIGLFISSRIVERHKGKLWVESKIGKGSTFYFSLPV
jgi:signal transduction histidine kinase